MEIFPADQLLIMQSERFFEDPPLHMARVSTFLGLAGFDFASSPRLQKIWGGGVTNALKKAEDYPEMNPETRLLLDSFFRPWNEKLSELTGMEFAWE
jgi:N-acetylgalactosamine 4-sulfate 6-O-sulfotransferase